MGSGPHTHPPHDASPGGTAPLFVFCRLFVEKGCRRQNWSTSVGLGVGRGVRLNLTVSLLKTAVLHVFVPQK